MSALDLFTFTAWTLASPTEACALNVDRASIQWCDGTCASVTEVTAPSPNRWLLQPQGVEIIWTGWESATVECKGKPLSLTARWDTKSKAVAPDVPREQINAALGIPTDTIVPGRWSSASRECVQGTTAWSFAPLGSRQAIYVAPEEGTGWRVEPTKSGIPVMCPGGLHGGLYPQTTTDPVEPQKPTP